jgi:hypothetical protein
MTGLSSSAALAAEMITRELGSINRPAQRVQIE